MEIKRKKHDSVAIFYKLSEKVGINRTTAIPAIKRGLACKEEIRLFMDKDVC